MTCEGVPTRALGISWDSDARGLRILDQTLLPLEIRHIVLRTVEDVHEAIRSLRVRGAPAIGIAAAFGAYIGLVQRKPGTLSESKQALESVCAYLATSRPTAVNLFWALEKVKAVAKPAASLEDHWRLVLEQAMAMLNHDNEVCRAIGEHGAKLIKNGDTILTHCNAGGLATAGWGTALAAMYVAHEKGVKFKVYADETRPLLQGARLTAFELQEAGLDVTLICDNMAGSLMRKGEISSVMVGTDRVAANGDVCNKIGTYSLACLASVHGIPFYVACPTSTLDLATATGDDIPIEERDPAEVVCVAGVRTAPLGIKVKNPAFDVTPNHLVSAIITEYGVLYPPYPSTLQALVSRE